MNNPELRVVCKLLGSADFWGAWDSGEVAQSGEGSAIWDEANQLAQACLKFLFLDHETFSTVTQFKSRMESLEAKLRRLNEGRERLARMRRERSDVRRALISLARQGWIDALQEEPDEAEEQAFKSLSLSIGRRFKFMLESAIALDDPSLVLRLSSLWAFGSRKLSRRMARERGLEVSQLRHWAGLLKRFIHTALEDERGGCVERPEGGRVFVGGFEDFMRVDAELEEQLVADEALLGELTTSLERSKRRLRESLVGLLIGRLLSPDAIGDAAISRWGLEVQLLRRVLWHPLELEEQFWKSDTAAGLSAEEVRAILSENDLALKSDALAFWGGRLAGGNLDRNTLLFLREKELEDYLRETVSELASVPRFDFLPATGADAADVRAELDIARRTAMEIIKLRSFIKASLEAEVEEVSEVIKRQKSLVAEGLRPSGAGERDVKELRAAVASLRRDIARLGKQVQDEMSRTIRWEMIKDFLFVIDDLSRIIKHARNESTRGLREGLEMIISRLEQVLMKYDICRIKAVGEMFDPSVHDCAGVNKVAGCKAGVVLEEVSCGFRIGEKVLRPAKVIVCG